MEPFIGQIIMFGGNFDPRAWAFCNGQLLAISQNTALFSILGTTYGGDGRTTFALPDLRGRVAIHPGTGPGLTPRKLGQRAGLEVNTLNVNQLPSHAHSATGEIKASNADGTTSIPCSTNHPAKAKVSISRSEVFDANIYSDAANTTMAADGVAVTVGNTGGNQYINNMQPFLGVNYIIALQGTFPSRN
jgi:microcystin-dependent protein